MLRLAWFTEPLPDNETALSQYTGAQSCTCDMSDKSGIDRQYPILRLAQFREPLPDNQASTMEQYTPQGLSINYVTPKWVIFDPPSPSCNTFGQNCD